MEWDDFEVKEASGGLPKSMWDTVSAFSNTNGGIILLGVKEKKTEYGSIYSICGVSNPEQMEQDIVGVLRSRTKFNSYISCKVSKYLIEGKTVLAFEIPLSPHRPISIKNSGEVYIRTGSGDLLATDLEIDAIVRDCLFGSKTEQEIPWSSFADLNLGSIESYRSFLRDLNRPFSFPTLGNEEFCQKLNIVLSSGRLSYGSMLMFGKRESLLRSLPNFWLDYMEIPGQSYATASRRYTYRMPEQENIWESFLLIMHRIRNYVDAPYVEGPDVFGAEDNSRLYCLREGVVNFCAHTDYFASAHPTIRVFDDKIMMQNPGRFILDADEFRNRILSMPRNPSIIRFFRHARLAENAGYGIDKILGWEKITGKPVAFESDIMISTVTYYLESSNNSRHLGEKNGENSVGSGEKNGEKTVLSIIKTNSYVTQPEIAALSGFSLRKVNRIVSLLRKKGLLLRIGKTKGGHWEIADGAEG